MRTPIDVTHDRLYNAADKILKKFSACSTCPVGCATKRKPYTRSWCCGGCKYLDPDKGCTVQALYCKVWLCGKEAKRNPSAYRALNRIENIAYDLNLLVERGSKEDALAKHRENTA